MVGYYHTEADREFVAEVLTEWQDVISGSLRIAYDPQAKKGRKWRWDGEEIDINALSMKLRDTADEMGYESTARKVGNVGTRHSILSLLAYEVGKLSGDREGGE